MLGSIFLLMIELLHDRAHMSYVLTTRNSMVFVNKVYLK